MVKTAIVKFSDIVPSEKNPIGCMSALRFTDGCMACNHFQQARYPYKVIDGKGIHIRVNVEDVVKSLACKPIVTDEQIKDMELQDKLYSEEQGLIKKIQDIDKKYNIKR